MSFSPISSISHALELARQAAEAAARAAQAQQAAQQATQTADKPELVDASQAAASDWMGQSVADDTSLADLTIPGTHDSGATTNGTPVPNTANAQSMSLGDQLDAGVRFVDLRLKADADGNMHVYHGPIRQPQSGAEALQDVSDFLEKHPGETVLISIKNEGSTGGQNDIDFQNGVEGLMAQHPGLFSGTSTVPTMGEVRGQAVLIRRYDTPQEGNLPGATRGIDATGWPDNTAGPAGDQLQVSDHYAGFDSETIPANGMEKWNDVQLGMNHALRTDDPALSITFASATNMTSIAGKDVPLPNAITHFSDVVNPQLQHFAEGHRGGAGVVAVDHADPELIRSLINMNSATPGVCTPIEQQDTGFWDTAGDSVRGWGEGAGQLWGHRGGIADAAKDKVVDAGQGLLDGARALGGSVSDAWGRLTD